MTVDLKDKVVLITGGAAGIGEATARLCAARGARVILADVNTRGQQVADEILKTGVQADFIPTDVRSDEQVSALFQFAKQQYGKLDGLVCAAGVLKGAFQSPEELPLDAFELVQDINVKGVFLCAKHGASLLENGGVMIVIASGAGVVGPSSSLAYGASKGGANGLSMTLAAHLEKRNIRVNTLCPGNIVTDLKLSVEVENAQRKGEDIDAAIAAARQNYGTPDGVARIIAFMISDEADYLRGAVFTR